MTPAVWPRESRLDTRLLLVDPAAGSVLERRICELPSLLSPGDLIVVNDAGTLPASLAARSERGPLELRLAGAGAVWREWDAVLFGAGSWRQRTEDRPPPPALAAGDGLAFDGGLSARVTRVSAASSRLVTLDFDRDGAALWSAFYRAGRPVQYSHLSGPLPLWHVQTAYAARPWSVEMPSAGRPLALGVLRDARRRGVRVAAVTHAAGLSATGEPALDALLPLPERYEVPLETVDAVARARNGVGRVVAVGTTVVRALEGCAAANGGRLRAGQGVTDLHLSRGFAPVIVDGLLTGLHEPGTSHFSLLEAFAPGALLDAAHRHAEQAGYLAHEFGDVCLVLPGSARAGREDSKGSFDA
jgi:S-adenosylmethionine:tRNA ribosyltransferase-isomerase